MDTAQTEKPADGRALLAEFIRQNTTQAQFARDVHCSDSHLSLILSGDRGVSLKLAKKMSEASGIPIEALPHEKAPEGAQP